MRKRLAETLRLIYKSVSMKMDNLRRYINLRDSLVREKATLEQRLQEINNALGEGGGGVIARSGTQAKAEAKASQPSSTTQAAKPKGRRGRVPKGGISLRDAVVQVLSKGPKTKEEILGGVKGLGYQFSTNNPMNSLGVILYGKNPRFKNDNGLFSIGGDRSTNTSPQRKESNRLEGTAGGAFARKKRQLNPEARERIAAAQRERWAKRKAG